MKLAGSHRPAVLPRATPATWRVTENEAFRDTPESRKPLSGTLNQGPEGAKKYLKDFQRFRGLMR